MGTLDKTVGPQKGFIGSGAVYVLKKVLDFSTDPVVANDVIQLMDIPAGTRVLAMNTKIITPVGATCTGNLGDGSGADSFDAAVNLNATAGTITGSAGGTDAYCIAGGKLYTAADTLDLTIGHNATAGKVAFYAVCVDVAF